MTALIAILLYLMAVVSPGTYTDVQIQQISNHHQEQINAIYQDSNLYNHIQKKYGPQAEQVIVIDTDIQN